MRQHITIKDIARIAGDFDFYRLPRTQQFA